MFKSEQERDAFFASLNEAPRHDDIPQPLYSTVLWILVAACILVLGFDVVNGWNEPRVTVEARR